ncbi:DUF551 domain-containing protein [Klebsiella pneumoniae]|nr:DUF551 domain-containing protein [Klebsiella pneumoniae]
MTKSTITRERLQEIAEDGFLKQGESKELARMALAAMDSEPVAWTWQHLKQWHVTNDEARARDLAWDGVKVEPLYCHAQHPEVPPEMTAGKAVHHWSGGHGAIESFVAGCNFYRAAMLTSSTKSSGSEPATVPDKWIPASERLPIPGVDVLVAKEFFGPGDWRRKVGHVRHEDGGWNIYGASWAPTHWMPLPAAPQEVKGES